MNIKKSTVAVMALLLSLLVLIALVPITAMADSNSTVVLHPSSGTVPTGVKVKLGDKIDGHPVTGIKGNDITVDLGKYNVSLDEFRIPLPEEIWEGVKMQYNPQTYVTAGTAGAVHKTPGANALLANGKNTFYYYNLGKGEGDTDTGSYLWNFELKFDANGGTGAPRTLTYGTNDKYTKSHTFTIPDTIPTRDGYTFRGWADTKNATEATRQPGDNCLVSATSIPGYNGGSGSKTLYAVWQLNEIEPSEPESSNTSEPESSNTSEPESSNTSEPESSNTSEPESSNTSEPESSNTSEPESSNTSEPESSNTSEPESSNTSEISGDPSGDNSDESSNTGDDSNTGDNESSNAGDNSGAGDNSNAGDNSGAGDNSNAGDNSGSSDNSNAGDSSDSGKNPQTGENSFTLMIALLFLCGSAVVGTAVVSRKQKAN